MAKTNYLQLIALAAIFILASGCAQAQTHSVKIESGGLIGEITSQGNFNPDSITIRAGDTVAWINADDKAHTVTSDAGSELGSSPLSPGQTYSHTFLQSGTYPYHCTLHPEMKGVVIVQ